jgi:hypothetical protein
MDHGLLLKALTHRAPLRSVLARRFVKQFSLFSYEERLSIEAVDRPNYGYCIFQAARLASLLKYPRISVIEFGCGGGNGLLNAELHIKEVMKIFPVNIDLYGFDREKGLPPPVDYRDMPYYFRAGFYEMDRSLLERQLKRAKLVILWSKPLARSSIPLALRLPCLPTTVNLLLRDFSDNQSSIGQGQSWQRSRRDCRRANAIEFNEVKQEDKTLPDSDRLPSMLDAP